MCSVTNLQMHAHKPPDHGGLKAVMMVCAQVLHIERQYTNPNGILQALKLFRIFIPASHWRVDKEVRL